MLEGSSYWDKVTKLETLLKQKYGKIITYRIGSKWNIIKELECNDSYEKFQKKFKYLRSRTKKIGPSVYITYASASSLFSFSYYNHTCKSCGIYSTKIYDNHYLYKYHKCHNCFYAEK